MPLDTSIALGVQNPQFQTIDPMTIYNAMQERQMNALRAQALQQTMAQNALIMQNTMEDRAAARAQRAQEQALLAQRRDILGNFGVTDRAVGAGPGLKYSNNNLSNSPFDYTANKLIATGDIGTAEALRKAQNEALTGQKTATETKGLDLKNLNDEFNSTKTLIGSAGSPEAVLSIFDAKAPLITAIGGNPEKSKQDFTAMLSNPSYGATPQERFQNAVLHVSQGIAGMQKHVSDMMTAETTRNKPIEMDLGGKRVLVDPITLQPKAEFEKTLTPDEAAKSGKTTAAKSSLDDTLARLDEEYTALSNLGAQPSEKESVATNLGRRFTSSYIGQSLGVNPQAQTHIQNIEGLRNDVLLAIKNATGMSAKEMDSNVELQRQLAGATAPGQNIESVRRRLTDISKKYGAGKDFTKIEQKPAETAPTTGGGYSVVGPDNMVHTFPSAEALAQFKKKAGIP